MGRMIECPACHGNTWRKLHPWSMLEKCTCEHGRIHDRRAPTANDRAVERIKDFCLDRVESGFRHGVVEGRYILDIIREESDRG